jgi:hypothetical protein
MDSIRATLSLGDEAIMVSHQNGEYEIPGAAEVENWNDVVNNIDGDEESVTVESLEGWGWSSAVHITMADGSAVTYFVR